jgi:hypothetical protein
MGKENQIPACAGMTMQHSKLKEKERRCCRGSENWLSSSQQRRSFSPPFPYGARCVIPAKAGILRPNGNPTPHPGVACVIPAKAGILQPNGNPDF